MNAIHEHLLNIHQQIQSTAHTAGRKADTIKLLAVSKQQSTAAIREAYTAGQYCFGENYLQEALEKMQELADLAIEWHFIGRIQRNKTRLIAEHFAWVHTVDSIQIAERLDAQRPANCLPLQICIQVNLAHESQKAGIPPEELPALINAISALPQITLRGLMLIPPNNLTEAETLAYFQKLAQLQQSFHLDTLSMGMSRDYPLAIAAGATIVRIGSAIFGNRPKVLK